MSTTEDRHIGIGEFRQRATEIIRGVEESARPVIVARRGQPVVEIRALRRLDEPLLGSVEVSPDVDLTEPVVDPGQWEAAD
jgi:antitoxin (DNA-binding transcriptional repressor) of toxin-antitoxin stability system